MILPLINPPAKEDNTEPPGNVIASIVWPEGNNDVDMWLTGPQELNPVGYSNKSGLLWNLLRDDVGDGVDATPLNYENAYTRGILEGEYIVNVHCYRCSKFPIPVTLEIGVKKDDESGTRTLVTTSAELNRNGQEITMLRFKLDKDANLVQGSMSDLFKQLRDKSSDGTRGWME